MRWSQIRGGWAKGIFRTYEDPESFSAAQKKLIPVGTIVVREGVTPRRVYFRTKSGLYRLVASGTTQPGGSDSHTHAIQDVDVQFKAV